MKLYVAMVIILLSSMFILTGCTNGQNNSSIIEKGRIIFNGDGMCFGCHGKDADGKTNVEPLAAHIKPVPPNLREKKMLYYQKNEDIFQFLKERIHGPVTDEEILQLVAYLQTIRK